MRLDEAPLVVRDKKCNRRRFVILDHKAYERLVGSCEDAPAVAPKLSEIDFAHHGLFWDRPTMTNERFAAILSDSEDPEHRWAWARALERLPSRIVTGAVRLSDLRRLVSLVKLRPRVRDAWESAIEFWTQEARRRLV